VWRAAYSPDGKRILSAAWDYRVKIWDARTGLELATLPTDERVEACAYSPDGDQFVIAMPKKLIVYDSNSGECVAELSEQYGSVKGCLWSPTGNQIVSGSGDNALRIWDPSSGKLLLKIQCHSREILPRAYSPDGSRIVTAEGGLSSDPVYCVWDAESGALISTMQGYSRRLTNCCFTPDGNFVCSTLSDSALCIWHAMTGEELHRFRFPARVTSFVCISDRLIAVGDQGGDFYLLELCNHELL